MLNNVLEAYHMVNQARMSAEINEGDLARAASSISAYLAGKQQTPKEAAAAEAFLNTLSEDQIGKLKSLSMKENYTGPKLEPGVIYGIWIDRVQIMKDSLAAADQIKSTISDLTKLAPKVKEKLLDVIDTVKPISPPQAVTPIEMTVQQQQAYLKVLGHDIGKSGLDGVAGKGSMTQKALDEFARKNGIDPKDTQKVNRALSEAVMGTKTLSFLERIQKEIDTGKASPDDIKTVQWLLKGGGAKMPLSLHRDKMDGIAGDETKTILKARISDITSQVTVQRIIEGGSKEVTPAVNTELQKFYDSLTPEQRDIQKKIAALGGSQPIGEMVGILSEFADGYYHGKTVQGNIYDGGFPNNRMQYPYQPSDEVRRLQEQFDKSLTPEQIRLRDSYIKSDTLPEKRIKFGRDSIEYPITPKNPILFRENVRDLLNPPKVTSFGRDDGFGAIKVTDFEIATDFGKAARGDIGSSSPPKIAAQFSDDVVLRRERLQSQSFNPLNNGAK